MSFGWTCLFREGSWKEFRSFVLNQKKNVGARLETIDYELSRIGSVSIFYKRENEEDDFSPMTERRLGIAIKTNTSIAKLIRAYVARGGNFFDISMFLTPDSYEFVDGKVIQYEPFGGVLAPQSGDHDDQVDEIGLYDVWKDPARKLGSKKSIWDNQDANLTGNRVLAMRGWVSQEIKELRNDLEARILKLCDLREQLLIERNELILGAVAGAVGDTDFNPDLFLEDLHTSTITYFFYTEFFLVDEEGKPDFTKPNPYLERALKTLLDNAPTGEEKYTAL